MCPSYSDSADPRFPDALQPLVRLFVVALHVPEALRRRYFLLILPPECDDAFTPDHLEPSLLARRPNITAIDANRDRTNR